VVETLGYEIRDGEYQGYSPLRPIPENRSLYFSCFHENTCLASIEGHEEYIYHYGNRPEEILSVGGPDRAERPGGRIQPGRTGQAT
jgi:hypothetical protein